MALAAATTPLVIILDDAQWADTATLRLTAFVAGELRTMPVLLVLTVRSNEPDAPAALLDCLGEMARAPGSLRVELHGLGLAAVQEWLSSSGLRFPTAATAALVHDRTAGNPLFVRELVALMGSEIDWRVAWRGARLVPDVVQDVIRRRIGRLPPVTQQLLVTAAVVGRSSPSTSWPTWPARPGQRSRRSGPGFAAGILEEDRDGVARSSSPTPSSPRPWPPSSVRPGGPASMPPSWPPSSGCGPATSTPI